MKKEVIITAGDPAGVGPFIIVKALSRINLKRLKFTLIGSKSVFNQVKGFHKIRDNIDFVDIPVSSSMKRCSASLESGRASFLYLKEAVCRIKKNNRSSLVTAPVSKEAISQVKKDFTGHTEFFTGKFRKRKFAMMMVGKKLRIVFLTRHILIRHIGRNLDQASLRDTLTLTSLALKKMFKIARPKIGLCSLNPHAGITTYLDREEKLLLKVVNRLRGKDVTYIGPYPSDTLFKEALNGTFDAVVAFYHDQGMIPFKTCEFSSGVNLTLGLPFIRTSPAHGPAFFLADKLKLVDYNPMKEAIELASKLGPCCL